MAGAQVTVKVTPKEHRIMQDALNMYAYAMRHVRREGYEHPLQGFQLSLWMENDPRRHAALAQSVHTQIS